MAKQKVVLKLSMEDAKKRAKAMKCPVGLHGVESASRDGDKITVVGEGIDSVALTTLLRKKLGYAELVTVTTVEEKMAAKAEPEAKGVPQICWPPYYGGAVAPPYYAEARDPCYDDNNNNNPCCIM